MELRFNEPLYINENLGITNDLSGSINSKIYGKERERNLDTTKPRYREHILLYRGSTVLTKSNSSHCNDHNVQSKIGFGAPFQCGLVVTSQYYFRNSDLNILRF